LACAGPLDPLLGPKSSLCGEKMAAWEAAAGQGPALLLGSLEPVLPLVEQQHIGGQQSIGDGVR